MGFGDFIGNNAVSVDAASEETSVRSKYPLLLHPEEHIELAFKSRGGGGRDKSYFTTHRVLIKDGKGIGSKRKNYLSIPYTSLQAFSVETAGAFDGDGELKLFCKGAGKQKIDFSKGNVDMFGIQQFLNMKMRWRINPSLTDEDPINGTPASVHQSKPLPDFLHWLGDNAHQLDSTEVERHLKNEAPVLCADEPVKLAFKTGRDSLVLTDRRVLIVDVQGLRGKKVEFWSFPWSVVHAFAVKTAGAYFDGDSELYLYTNIREHPEIQQDFRKNKVDLFAIQSFVRNRVLGGEETATIPDVPKLAGHIDPKTSWWFRENQRPLDAVEMDRFYHATPPLLQVGETVEMAFKGRRDVTLFTTKRVIDIDARGASGTSIKYTSLPWKSIIGFGAKTAGKHFDSDAEIMLYTEMMFEPKEGEDPPEPGMAMCEIDFNKKMVNVMAIKKYVAEHVLGSAARVPIPADLSSIPDKEQGFEKFLSKIGSDNLKFDPTELNTVLHTTNPILLENENIVMAFRSGRDIQVFTNLRIMEMDVQGWSGEKIKYTSIPYSSIRAFSAESAGGWDRDSELDLYTRNTWSISKVGLDFRKGKADVIILQKFLSAILMGTEEDMAKYFMSKEPIDVPVNKAGMQSFLSFLSEHSKSIEASVVDFQLHADPPVLLDDERVVQAFKEGRDMYAYTSHRLLVVDVQGLRGKKVEYKSIPLHQWCAYEIETAGHLDTDAEAYIHCDIPSIRSTKQSILVKTYDIYEMNSFLTKKVLFRESG